MRAAQGVDDGRSKPSGSALPVWWVVASRELADLWIGGKAAVLLVIFSVVMGVMAYVLASNSELSLIPPKEMVFETLKDVLAIAGIIGLIIGADMVSGERERSTIETLLLTPASRRQIVVGKFIAAISPWPVAFAITIPYWKVLSQGDEIFGQAVLWGAIMGSLLSAALAGLGILVSIWSNSNRTSFFVSLGIYVAFLVPSQLPGTAQTGAMGQLLQWVNPVAATTHFLAKILVNNVTLEEFWPWLTTPVLFPAIVLGLLFLVAGPRLGFEARAGGLRRSSRGPRAPVLSFLLAASLAAALAIDPGVARAADPTGSEPTLGITVDLEQRQVKAGDPILFNTVVANRGSAESPPITLAMNIISLEAEGGVVDPEDWSPQRTQYVKRLAPGQAVEHRWRVNAILDGDYMIYIVAIPEPDGPKATSQPVTTAGIHLSVAPFTRLNPGGVLPLSLGMPAGLALGAYALVQLRRRSVDEADDQDDQTIDPESNARATTGAVQQAGVAAAWDGSRPGPQA